MNTQLVAKEFKLSHWSTIVQECNNSGMKVKDWCQQHNISKDAYYYWLRKVREAACESIDTKFVRVPDQCVATSYQSVFLAELTIAIGSAIVSINSTTPQHLIEKAVRALSNVE